MTKKQHKIIPNQIHLQSVNIIQASLHTDESFLDAPKPIKEIESQLTINFAHSRKDRRSRLRIYFEMSAMSKEGSALGVNVNYGIEFHYFIENFEDFISTKNNELQMNIDLPATLAGMSYSTARGIIFERTRGTLFHGVILPVVNPYDMVTEKSLKFNK